MCSNQLSYAGRKVLTLRFGNAKVYFFLICSKSFRKKLTLYGLLVALNQIFMNIQELTSILCDTLRSGNKGILPGIGTFTLEDVPSEYSEDGNSISAPSKRVVFSTEEAGEATEESKAVLGELNDKGVFELPGFGVLKKVDKDILFEVDSEFVADPEAYGLEDIHLEGEPTAEPEPKLEPEPEPESVPEPEPKTEQVAEPEPEVKREKKAMSKETKALLWIAGVLVALIILVLVIYLFRESLAPYLKYLLYSKEELEVLNYKL